MQNTPQDLTLSVSITESPNEIIQIEVLHAPTSVFIGRTNFKKFIISSSLSLFFTHLILVVWSGIYLVDSQLIISYFVQSPHLTAIYLKLCISFYLVALVATSASRRISRVKGKYLIVLLMNMMFCYFAGALLRFAMNPMVFMAQKLMFIYGMFYCSSFGLFVNCLIGKKKFRFEIGIWLGSGFYVILEMMIVLYFKVSSPALWILFLYLLGATALSFYFNFTIYLMLTRRYDFYLIRDWVLGYSHLQTYLFFYFWWDLFVINKTKPKDFNENANNFVTSDQQIEIK